MLPALMALTACGGGGGGSGVELPSGRFLDSAVAGLSYSTPTLTGVTDSDGRFNYRSGETVSFYLQGLYIGQAQGAAVLTPGQLAPSGADADYGLNLLRLLQSLDTDHTPGNGITLGGASMSQSIAQGINLSQPTDTFAASSSVTNLMAWANTTLVSAGDASDHFADTVLALTGSNSGSYTIDLSTRTVSSATLRVSGCPTQNWTISFHVADVTINGNEVDASCSTSAWPVSSMPYVGQGITLWRSGLFLPCGPVCTLADLNQTYSYVDDHQQPFQAKVAHLAGSREILITKTASPTASGVTPARAAYTAFFRLVLAPSP